MKIITFTKNDIRVDIKFSSEENTVWMSQKDMATLFKKGSHAINNHLRKLDQNGATFHYLWIVAQDGKLREVGHYNLDIIKQVGYKIDPNFTNEFVSWCEGQLNSLNHQNIPIQSNIIRFNNGSTEIEVEVEPMEQTVWMTQKQIALLFDTTQQNISLHIRNIVNENELADDSVHKEYLYTALDGKDYKVSLYNLDMILAIGYRTKTKKAIEFRRWVTQVLKLYINNGDHNLITGNDYIQLVRRIDKIDTRLEKVEKEHQVIFPNGQLYKKETFIEAQALLRRLMNLANDNLVIIDPYVDEKTLEIVRDKKEHVKCLIITSQKSRIKGFDEDNIEIILDINSESHDRFLIIDNSIYYSLGPSLNYFGYKMGEIKRMDNKEDMEYVKEYIQKLKTKKEI